tara:strand:- start:3449 stop:3937 length:489 start_codon:yes stop_codon:yes gene_type:complete
MKKYNILFLCTHNSSRSILAEALASTDKSKKFNGYSAGSEPSGKVNQIAKKLAIQMGYSAEKIRSKNWHEFAKPHSPQMDIIITVCDNAAGEVCPIWPGKPVTAHWGYPDPSALVGNNEEKLNAFKNVLNSMKCKIQLLSKLPLDSLDNLSLQNEIKKIEDI